MSSVQRKPTTRHAIGCPHCRSDAVVRSNRRVDATYRQLYVQCSNVECGHTFGAEIVITHTIVPSACPDPNVHLRRSAPRARAPALAIHTSSTRSGGPEVPPANDDDPCPCAVATGG